MTVLRVRVRSATSVRVVVVVLERSGARVSVRTDERSADRVGESTVVRVEVVTEVLPELEERWVLDRGTVVVRFVGVRSGADGTVRVLVLVLVLVELEDVPVRTLGVRVAGVAVLRVVGVRVGVVVREDELRGVGAGAAWGLGFGAGLGAAWGLGFGVGLGDAWGFGFGFGFGVGAAWGFGFGFGVGAAWGFGFGFAWVVRDEGRSEVEDNDRRPSDGLASGVRRCTASAESTFRGPESAGAA